jgi:hypothetical protein
MRARHWSYPGEKNRKAALIRDGYQCQIRGANCEGWTNTVDHIIAKAQGGSDALENLRAACPPCNGAKWMHSDERESGDRLRFFSGHSTLQRPLRNLSARSRWTTLATDYSRKKFEA